jgi:hypothetical protein
MVSIITCQLPSGRLYLRWTDEKLILVRGDVVLSQVCHPRCLERCWIQRVAVDGCKGRERISRKFPTLTLLSYLG